MAALVDADDVQAADDNYDPFKLANVHESFTDKQEVLDLINRLKEVHTDLIKTERAIERFTLIVDSYQEQPHLLDPYLDEFVNLIISKARQSQCEVGHRYLLFTCLHLLVKMRGYKVITRWMPHEVADVEPVLDLLSLQDPSSVEPPSVVYGLLWRFTLHSIGKLDNTETSGHQTLPVMDRILNQAKIYIGVADKSNDAAAYVLAKFLTRPDVRAKKMAETIDWALNTLEKSMEEVLITNHTTRGILMMLSQLFKYGKREDLIPYGKRILDVITRTPVRESYNIVIRKLGVKLIQRVGLVFLKAKVTSWRYNRGNRSLAANLAAAGVKLSSEAILPAQSARGSGGGDNEEEDYDIPDEIEEIIEQLLTSLKDKDTIIRWSAAKGVGRVCGRLPKELADDVIGSLLDLFTFHETDAAWHGGCLALAELGRRGLLLPQRLPDVVPLLLKALVYDEKKGNFSVGAHVRDSACYVCWAFARAYDPADMKSYSQQIASSLITVAVFDREVNVRRAASAAFQENVGRQGTFPHGIDILTTCDFFAVGNRINSYLELSKFVAGFPEYTEALIEHLMEHKVNHWAEDIRELTAKALYNLTSLAPTYVLTSVLPRLLPMTLGPDLNCRHGSIQCVGQICLSLSDNGKAVGEQLIKCIVDIEPMLRSRKLLLGLGGEYMRKALCSMIKDLSQVKEPETNLRVISTCAEVIDQWQSLLDECLFYVENFIQQAAVDALPSFLQTYEDGAGQVPSASQDKVLGNYLKLLSNPPNLRTATGTILALGSLPQSFLKGRLSSVLYALITCSRARDKDWTEARASAFKSIERICVTVGVDDNHTNSCISQGNCHELYEAFLHGLDDYTIDSRGDIGAWVREACMSAILTLTSLIVVKRSSLLDTKIVGHFFKKIVQQACEKIDRTRYQAGTTLTSLLYLQPEVPEVPERTTLQTLFPRDKLLSINFAAPGDTFSRFSQLLDFDAYRYNVLLGFSVSVGGLTESLVKHSYSALIDHIQTEDGVHLDRLRSICSDIVTIFQNYVKDDRVTIPLMKMTEQLLSSGVFDDLVSDSQFTFPLNLFECVKTECSKSGDPQKLMTGADVLCGLLTFEGEVRKKCFLQLAIYLCHRFPIVRKSTAKLLFEMVVAVDDLIEDEDKSEEVMTLLSDTAWDDAIEKIKPVRNQLCDLLGISRPVAIKKPSQNKTA